MLKSSAQEHGKNVILQELLLAYNQACSKNARTILHAYNLSLKYRTM